MDFIRMIIFKNVIENHQLQAIFHIQSVRVFSKGVSLYCGVVTVNFFFHGQPDRSSAGDEIH